MAGRSAIITAPPRNPARSRTRKTQEPSASPPIAPRGNTIKFAVLVLALGILSSACATSHAGESASTATATVAVTPAAQPTATPTQEPTPSPAPEPVASPALKPPVSEVLSASEPPQSAPVRSAAVLPVPEGTSVVWGGCASDGECHSYNFYWAPTYEAVMQNGEGQIKVQHELCHAHQHWSISAGAPLPPADYDLESWYTTAEGGSFVSAIAGLPWPWSHSAVNVLEDFAWTCAHWYLDPAYLLQTSPERYDWAARNLP